MKKDLINIQNTDNNECFKWCLVRYFNPTNHYPAGITKTDKGFPKKFDFKGIKFSVKSKNIHQIEKRISTLVFLHMKTKTSNLCIKNMLWRKTCWFIINRRRRKKHYVLVKDFSTFMYHHSLKREKTFLSLLFIRFHYKRNIETSYSRLN